MSNLKSNNRFIFLNENETQNISIQKDSFRENDYNKQKYKPYNKFKSEVNCLPPKKEFVIKENEFPELSNTNTNTNISKQMIEIKETNDISCNWSSYKFEDAKLKINESSTIVPKTISYENRVKLNEAEEIIEALSDLHEKRSKEYIDSWGEEEWERMFIFPNYDYEYFDKLDEAYEIEQNKINEQYSNCNNNNDYDYYGEQYDDDF